MRFRLHNHFRLLMALLFTLSAFAPAAVQAEAVMQCAGSAPNAHPCARVVLPAAGLTAPAAEALLMACCRHSHCRSIPQASLASYSLSAPASLSRPHCRILIHALGTSPAPLQTSRSVPPQSVPLFAGIPPAIAPASPTAISFPPTQTSPLTHALPAFHGLRAPPAA